MTGSVFKYMRGDIVRRRDSPCEVMYVEAIDDGRALALVLVIDKRTLLGEFVFSDDLDLVFVRRPDRIECANGGTIRGGRFFAKRS